MTPPPGSLVRAGELRSALRENLFVVHYQPVVSLVDGRVAGAEALLRMKHPELGLLAPAAFMKVAEKSGHIVELGRVVLRDACAAAASWAPLGTAQRPFRIAVNLSAKQLTAPSVIQLITECLSAAAANPGSLTVEIAESTVMSDEGAALTNLRALHKMGVAVALQDFGTRAASLSEVKRLPVSVLKVAASFVSGLGSGDDDAAIVAFVVGLARSMRLDCIAVGVETDQQRVALQELGCGFAQGELWSPAVDQAAFARWVTRHDPQQVVARTSVEAPASPRPRGRAAQMKHRAPVQVRTRVAALQSQGASVSTIAAALNAEGLMTPDGKRWHPSSVALLLAGLNERKVTSRTTRNTGNF